MTKHPCAWSLRNVARFSAGVGMGSLFAIGGVGGGDCLETSALCRIDRVPQFQKLVQRGETPRGMGTSTRPVRNPPDAKTEHSGTKLPECDSRIPESSPERSPLFAGTGGGAA